MTYRIFTMTGFLLASERLAVFPPTICCNPEVQRTA